VIDAVELAVLFLITAVSNYQYKHSNVVVFKILQLSTKICYDDNSNDDDDGDDDDNDDDDDNNNNNNNNSNTSN